MTPTLTPARPGIVPALRHPDRAYEIRDGERLLGCVSGHGRTWSAGRVGPLRSKPWTGVVSGQSRTEAVERLVEGMR